MAFAQYSVENAKSNRSTCKVCKAKIDKDALRIGTATEGPGDYLMTSWRHLECQKKPKNGLTDLTELAGMDALTADDQERVKTWFAAASAPKAPKSAAASSGGKKRAADDAPTGDSSAADLSGVNVKKMKAGDRKAALEASGLPTSGKKKDQEELLQDVADRQAAEAKFNPMTVNDLKELCRLNSQKISGNKQCAPASGPTNQCPSRLSLSSRHRVLCRSRACALAGNWLIGSSMDLSTAVFHAAARAPSLCSRCATRPSTATRGRASSSALATLMMTSSAGAASRPPTSTAPSGSLLLARPRPPPRRPHRRVASQRRRRRRRRRRPRWRCPETTTDARSR